MAQVLLLIVGALVVGAIVFGVAVLITGAEGLGDVEPDGRAVPLPGARPLVEGDFRGIRFDTAARGYRMSQVDQALRRAAYDIGYKCELIGVLEAEIEALREGRVADADALRLAREAAGGSRPEEDGDAGADVDLGAVELVPAGGDDAARGAADPGVVTLTKSGD
ncbi:MAG: DivIVA domain-containing protein [Micromonosporaceae bacterium]|nr:DivIVA domain-containing protein [Micromonosporaceae bacterium]